MTTTTPQTSVSQNNIKYSLQNTENYKDSIVNTTQQIIEKYTMLIVEYLKFIIENTNIQNAKLDTSNSGLIKELDSQNVNKVVEALGEQLNKKESQEIKSSKNLELSVNEGVNISPETIRELPNNLQLEEIVTNPSIIEVTNIQNDELSTGNNGLIGESDLQNVNEVIEGLAEQFNRKKNKEIISDKNLELPTNQNTNVNPETIKKLHNLPDLENTIREPT